MSDLMLLGILRAPRPHDMMGWLQLEAAAREAADKIDALHAKLDDAAIFCPHCQARWDYWPGEDYSAQIREALKHEQTCPKNPLVQERDTLQADNARLRELEVAALRFIRATTHRDKHNAEAYLNQVLFSAPLDKPGGVPLCPRCEHASHEWCNKRPEVKEAQTHCSMFKPEGGV